MCREIPYEDWWRFTNAMSDLDLTVTGFARNALGENIAVAPGVALIGVPFRLTGLRGANSVEARPQDASVAVGRRLNGARRFRVATHPDDQVWQFSSSLESWRHLGGRAGLALVRKGVVIDAHVTIMN